MEGERGAQPGTRPRHYRRTCVHHRRRRPHTGWTHHTNGGVYLNFTGHEGEERIRAAYGNEKYARLQHIKQEWDPGNVSQGNQNIRPAG